ncbi:M48 family metalloprotease [Pigmentiphaga aceris]|uniref:M48 family metalloprotease n=1 Tax=Pigmentiphaga aceris TaxID=1940612 RepID=A0A5C0AU36_9BURK|nr:M48 family metallopeptidase [Pigmentiphaga aceris]QEI04793.1 M48 family metalloprotease [Pigmentiphaga aceris]
MSSKDASGWRLSIRLLLGDAALVGTGLALCTAPIWLYAALPGVLGVAAAVLALTLPFIGWPMLRLPFAPRLPGAENGIPLTAADAPALFHEIEQVRARLDSPVLHAVYLTEDFNASIRQHRRLLGGTRNVLWLGLPLLEVLSADACRAILAHECAHIAGKHGRYASRVYFARLQWQEAARQLALRKGVSTGPLRLFMNWYVPRFLDASMGFARSCEYQADAEAARVCGADAAAEALLGLAVQGRALRKHWHDHYAEATSQPLPFTDLAEGRAWRVPQDEFEARFWLHEALCDPTTSDDTHPSLSDRLKSLGKLDAYQSSAQAPLPWQRACPSAASQWLQGQHLPLARAMDESQNDATAQRWRIAQNEQREALASYHDLLRKQRIRGLNADERATLAWHTDAVTGDVRGAVDMLTLNLRDHPDHVMSMCNLAVLLPRLPADVVAMDAVPEVDRLDGEVLAADQRPQANSTDSPQLQNAEELWRKAAAEPGSHQRYCLRQLTAAALRRNDSDQAQRYREEADRLDLQTRHEDASPRFEPHGLREAELRKLAQTLDPLLRAATSVWLLRDSVHRHHVLMVLVQDSWLSRAVGQLTGEGSYVQRDCKMLADRLLPRIDRAIEPVWLEVGDTRLLACTDADRVMRAEG